MNVKNLRFSLLFFLFSYTINAQVGVGNTNPQASLDISASNVTSPANNDGILIPRMSAFPSTPGATRDGMLIFYIGTGADGKGFYYWNQTTTSWEKIASGGKNTLDEAYDEGGAGAGRTITADNGSVQIDGDDGFQVTGTHGSGNTISLSGVGTRMFFNPRKSAFRAGSVANNQWNDANVGDYSFAVGQDNVASGSHSNALGRVNTVSGAYSNAFGRLNTASGAYSNALGRGNNASGEYAIAGAFSNTASGNASLAIGNSNVASGDFAVALGFQNTASGFRSFVSGSSNQTSGFASSAVGFNNAASGLAATAFGNANTAPSAYEFVVGTFNTSYTPSNPNNSNSGDRVFTVGNGTGSLDRSNALTIYKSGRMNINDSYSMPLADGSIGQLLTTDGNGQLSFVDPSSIFSNDHDWYEEGSTNQPDNINDNIYTQGNVGIGQNTPVSPLHIGISTPFDLDHANIGQDGIFIAGLGDNSGANAVGGSISFGPPSNTRGDQRKSAISSVQTSGDVDHTGLAFYVHGNAVNQSPMVEGMRLTHQRYLGINNTDPSANLDVIGTLQFEDGNEAVGYVLASDATGNATWTDPNTLIMGVERINDLIDGKSDFDGTEDGSSIFLGIDAGSADDSSNNRNVGIGYQSLENNTTGENNTGVGYLSLNNNIDGSQNTAVGLSTLVANTDGSGNTAIGYHALFTNNDGINNTATGNGALNSNVSGGYNTASGSQALFFNSGGSNSAFGYRALYSNTSGARNAATGLQSLNFNLTGNDNVAMGYRAGYTSTGNGNVFLGSEAGNGATGDNKIFVENTNADENSALIYGEFGADSSTTGNILRTNGELQIGNPTDTGYAFPTTDSANAGDVLTTDSNGVVTWTTPTEVDGDVTNELQDLTLTGDELQISSGTSASMRAFINPKYPDGFANVDPITFDNLVGSNRYTVPAGKNLYITNLFNNNNIADLIIDDAGAFFRHGNHQNNANLQTINSPIIVGSGATVETDFADFKINGFLVDAYCEPIIVNASYTVPVGKILVILNYRSSTSSDLTVAGVTIYNGLGTNTNTAGLTSFINPIFVDSGEVVNSSAASYDINGYLIDK